MKYEYIFSDCKFNLEVNKLFALNNKESETLLKFRQWDKKHLNYDDNQKLSKKTNLLINLNSRNAYI